MKKILMMLAICGAVSFTMASCGGGEEPAADAEISHENHDHGDHEDHDGH